MRRGEAKFRVNVMYKKATGTDDFGHTEYSERVLYAGVPCLIETLGGNELLTTRQIVAEATHRVTMQSLDVTEENWLDYCGQRFDIGAIDYFSGDMILTCTQTK